jgi:hypothetical protein
VGGWVGGGAADYLFIYSNIASTLTTPRHLVFTS